MKRISLGIIGLFIIVILASGCTSTANTKEVKVGTLNITYGMDSPEFTILKLPANTTNVRVEYDLDATNTEGGIAPNGNLGTANGVQKGEDPWSGSKIVDSKYLSGSNEQLTGNLTFKPGEFFVYSGMFKGKINVYATVPA